jgi:AcrR family transcriptional regulator
LSRKDEILAAVISKFEEEGFSTDLTISEIAKKVDIGKSTIYEYFKTKDDVFKEALLKISNESIDKIIDIENIENMDFEEAFKIQFSKILEVSLKSRMIYQIFSKDFIHRMPETIREELKQKMEDTRGIIEKRFILIFIKGVGENLLNIDPNPTSNLVYSSLIVGAIFRYSNSEFDIPVADFVNEIYKTILKLAN